MAHQQAPPGQPYLNMPEPSFYGSGGPADGHPNAAPHFAKNAHLSPSAAVFQPGGGAGMNAPGAGMQAEFVPHQLQSQHLSPMALNPANRSAPPPRLGLNPNAPSFNAFRPPSLSPGGLMPPTHMNQQPTSPLTGQLSPNLSVFSTSPGVQSSNANGSPFPQSWGLGTPGGMGSGRGGRRGSRGGLPVNQPLKTTGHNSKPSVSLNPAALSMMLASQKPKRKVVVKMPREIGTPFDGEGAELENDSIAERAEGENGEDDAAIEEQQRRLRVIRKQWSRRIPLEDVDVDQPPVYMPRECIVSCAVFPESDLLSDGLPDFIDIFLPGRSAWEDVKESFLQERIEKEERAAREVMTGLETSKANSVGALRDAKADVLDSPTVSLGHHRGQHQLWLMNQFSQTSINSAENDHLTPLASLTPARLRHVNGLTTPSPSRALHGQTMSLSIPSSGQPFGPSTLTALGLPSPSNDMERSYSDSEDKQEPALGQRPKIERGSSDWLPNRSNTVQEGSESPLWKHLGRGFGYDIDEGDEGGQSNTISRPTAHLDARHGADDSEHSDQGRSGAWQDQRRRISGDNSDDSGGSDASDSSDDLADSKSFSEEYSNPSDEEAARQARLRRRAIRAEKKTGRLPARERESRDQAISRPRSGTGETFASSAIAPQEEVEHSRRFSIKARGPLDDEDLLQDEYSDGLRRNSGPFSFQPLDAPATSSRLYPNAPAFTPRDSESTSHFRLPSIKTSSFGSSFSGNRGGLNAAAPAFTPGAFTFTAPGGAPKLPTLPSGTSARLAHIDDLTALARDSQGREKRQRHRGDLIPEEQEVLMSPPRLQPSAASIEGPLRDQAMNDGLPPFNADRSQGTFTFKPTAAPFYPTLDRGASSRLALPAFDNQDVGRRQANYAEEEHGSTMAQMRRSSSGKSMAGKRTPLASVWQQNAVPASDLVLEKLENIRSPQGKQEESEFTDEEGGNDDDDDDDDDDTVSDIIEELGDRMDKALEGWAGKILDEVTIMGQVRPVNMVTLDTLEKQNLVDLITGEIQSFVATQYEHLNDRLDVINARQARLAEGDDSTLTVTPNPRSKSTVGHSTLDAQGELDFDFVQDTLDHKIATLQQDLKAAFTSVLPEAMEKVSRQVRDDVDAGKLDAILKQLEQYAPRLSAGSEAPIDETVRTGPTNADLSTESIDSLTSLLIGRLQPVLQEASESNTRHRRAELTDVLEPILEEHLARTHAKGQADRQDVLHSLQTATAELINDRLGEWEKTMVEVSDGRRDSMQTALVQSIVAHMEAVRTDQLDADVIAAKVSAALMPILSKEGSGQATLQDDGTLKTLAQSLMEHLRPLLNVGEGRTLGGDDEFIQRLSKALSSGNDGQTELSAVIALLEPLVERQEESRSLSRRIMESQRGMESTLDALPSAVNTKLQVFLATSEAMQEQHKSLVEKLDGLQNSTQSGGDQERLRMLELERDDLLHQLDQARRSEIETRAELNEARAELSASNGYTSTLKEECTRLEARLDQAERDAVEIGDQTVELRKREHEAVERSFADKKSAAEWEGKSREWDLRWKAIEEQNQLLRSHIDQIGAELVSSREERAREREMAAQATAEALASRKAADAALAKERSHVEELLAKSSKLSEEARKQVEGQVERASKAEGQVATLEKRIAEQDGRISNLQQLSATQKQKAAQGGQKLSEVEKKLKEFEGKDRELMIAHTRLAEMETRLSDKDAVEERWRASQANEARLREEVTMHQSRFLDVERDLMAMKETLVDRELLEQAQNGLASSKVEIALLRGQLSEAQRSQSQHQQRSVPQITWKGAKTGPNHGAAWEESPTHGSSTWASIHAPNSSNDDLDPSRPSFVDESFESVPGGGNRSMSHMSSSRAVELNDDGWWS